MWFCFISPCPGLWTAHNLKKLNPNKRLNRVQQVNYFQATSWFSITSQRWTWGGFFGWHKSVEFSFHSMSSRNCSEMKGQQKGLCMKHSRGQDVSVWEGLWRAGLSVTQVFWQEHSFFCCMLWLSNELTCILPKHKAFSYLFVWALAAAVVWSCIWFPCSI